LSLCLKMMGAWSGSKGTTKVSHLAREIGREAHQILWSTRPISRWEKLPWSSFERCIYPSASRITGLLVNARPSTGLSKRERRRVVDSATGTAGRARKVVCPSPRPPAGGKVGGRPPVRRGRPVCVSAHPGAHRHLDWPTRRTSSGSTFRSSLAIAVGEHAQLQAGHGAVVRPLKSPGPITVPCRPTVGRAGPACMILSPTYRPTWEARQADVRGMNLTSAGARAVDSESNGRAGGRPTSIAR